MAGRSASMSKTAASRGGKDLTERESVMTTRGSSVRRHQGQSIARIVRIERQICSPSLKNREQGNDLRRRSPHAEPDDRVRPDPQATQSPCQPIRSPFQRSVINSFAGKPKSHRVWRAAGLVGDQIMQTRLGVRRSRVVPSDERLPTLVIVLASETPIFARFDRSLSHSTALYNGEKTARSSIVRRDPYRIQ